MTFENFIPRVIRKLKRPKHWLKLRKLKGAHRGKRCFILGNGPSLSLDDIRKIKDEVTFSSNRIYLLFDQTDWRPTFYTSEDHRVLEQNSDEISNLVGMTKLIPNAGADLLNLNGGEIIFKLCYPVDVLNPLKDDDFPLFSFDASKMVYWGSTVVYTQMQLAAHMGFTEIYLIGVDHSYVVPKEKDGYMCISEGEQNHFHPDYRKPGEKWNPPMLDVLFRSYSRAREICETRGVKIYNATRGGKLEIFERKSLEEAGL